LAYVTRVRPEKQAVVEQLREWIDQSKGMVFFSFEGLTSKDMQAMRAEMKRNGLTVKVVKNTLLELAVKEVGLNVDESLFRGTTALLFSSEDELAPFKLFIEQVKKYGVLQAKGGILEGRWISAKEVDAIAKLPGRQELYAQLVGVVSSPMRGLVTVLSGPYRNLVYVLQAIKEKKEKAA